MISHRVTLFVDQSETEPLPGWEVEDILTDMIRYAEQETSGVSISLGTITPIVTPTGPDGKPLY